MNKPPFLTLGSQLKQLREKLKESLVEVSGAVEIDADTLQKIEQGLERPPEDILLLLISHFDMQDHEAVHLWELAGYDGDLPDKPGVPEATMGSKAMVMLLALDLRSVYTDGINIEVGQTGLTMNFTQSNGQAQTAPVARVGMSFEQAQQVLKSLQTAILQSKYQNGPKNLPPPSDSSTSTA